MCRDNSPDGLDFILSSDVRYGMWTKVKLFYAVAFQFGSILLRICDVGAHIEARRELKCVWIEHLGGWAFLAPRKAARST